MRLRGATVARLTPDQKAACSNHVGVKFLFWGWDSTIGRMFKRKRKHASRED